MNCETFALPERASIPMVEIPGTGLAFGKYLITQAQWRAVMETSPSHFKGDNLPVESVSWHDCRKFCAKLSAYTGREFRLPTSAEWDIALAGQKASLETGWFWENSAEATHPLGLKEPNALGFYDMHGNVWEWCEDGESSWKYLRGGSWSSVRMSARAVARGLYAPPAARFIDLGFRVVCCVRPPSPDRPSLAAIVEQLALCDYQCEAGSLVGNTAFMELCEMAKLVSRRPIDRIEIDKCVAAIRYHFARARDGQRNCPASRRFVELEMGTLAEIMPADEFAALRREVGQAWINLAAPTAMQAVQDMSHELQAAMAELRAGARDEGCLTVVGRYDENNRLAYVPCGGCAWCRMFGGGK